MQSRTKTRKDSQRHAKTRKDVQRHANFCVSLSVFVCLCQLQTFFLLPLRVFVCLCASLPVFACLCVVWVSLRYLDRPLTLEIAARERLKNQWIMIMTTLAPSFLIGLSSFLQTSSILIKSQMGLNLAGSDQVLMSYLPLSVWKIPVGL